MKKILTAAALLALSNNVFAEGWELFPVVADDFSSKPAISLMAGQLEFKDADDSVSAQGVELSMTCPLIRPPSNSIRQQFSLVTTDEDNTTTLSFELSPHYMWKLSEKASVGFGPSLGLVQVDTNADKDTAFTYGLGASARFNITDSVLIGLQARSVAGGDLELSGADVESSNTTIMVKLGYQF